MTPLIRGTSVRSASRYDRVDLVAGKARRMARIVDELMDEVHVEGRGSLHPREQKPLIERQRVEHEKREQDETRRTPGIDHGLTRIHMSLHRHPDLSSLL